MVYDVRVRVRVHQICNEETRHLKHALYTVCGVSVWCGACRARMQLHSRLIETHVGEVTQSAYPSTLITKIQNETKLEARKKEKITAE